MIKQIQRKPQYYTAIQWTGDNLKDVLDFTGKSIRFNEWFKSFEDYAALVALEGHTFKLFDPFGNYRGIAYKGDYIVKDEYGNNYTVTSAQYDLLYEDRPATQD